MKKSGPGNDLQITNYMHCALCLKSLPKGESPESFARISAGWTKLGLQLWCNRHNANICHIDFEGQQHPANVTRPGRKQ